MYKITKVYARQILDSRGNPTVECEITLASGACGRASVPSGASTGAAEAHELRDGGADFMGRGVTHAVQNVNEIIAPAICGMDATKQREIDARMCEIDGTVNKSKLGANAVLAASLAVARAVANARGEMLYKYIAELAGVKNPCVMPRPMMNILNGGVHADNGLDAQEFMIIPVGAKSEFDAIRMGAAVFHNLKKILHDGGYSTNVGDEGGFAPNFANAEMALNAIMSAIRAAGFTPGVDIAIGLDMAASEFQRGDKYHYQNYDLTPNEIMEYYENLIDRYPIISIEDALGEEDWDNWKKLTKYIGDECQLVGDDLFVTNPARLKKGIDAGVANAILIKVNQIGTLTETLDAINMAKSAGYGVVISHRSGETEDTTIADLAVGTNAGQIKTGSMSRTDRVAKYNQLLRIAEDLGENAQYGIMTE